MWIIIISLMRPQVMLHTVLPGQKAQGTELPDRRRLTYKLNGTGHGGLPRLHIEQAHGITP